MPSQLFRVTRAPEAGPIDSRQYSGNADHQCGWLGVGLGGMDVINPVELIRNDRGHITGMRVVKSGASEETIDFNFIPTAEQVGGTQEKFDKLPDGLKAICPPIGIYIVWSTS